MGTWCSRNDTRYLTASGSIVCPVRVLFSSLLSRFPFLAFVRFYVLSLLGRGPILQHVFVAPAILRDYLLLPVGPVGVVLVFGRSHIIGASQAASVKDARRKISAILLQRKAVVAEFVAYASQHSKQLKTIVEYRGATTLLSAITVVLLVRVSILQPAQRSHCPSLPPHLEAIFNVAHQIVSTSVELLYVPRVPSYTNNTIPRYSYDTICTPFVPVSGRYLPALQEVVLLLGLVPTSH